jgi:hypothetical protein
MPVTVDQETLAAEALGLKTVGQLLSHVQRDNRLVVQLLIDGEQPDLDHIGAVKQALLDNRSFYIETADPHEMAIEVLDEVESQLAEADRLKGEASDLLQHNQHVRAMEKLGGCFTTWQHAQESVLKTAQLLRIDLQTIALDRGTLPELCAEFTAQLRQIKSALETRDFVSLTDILLYETTETTAQWRQAIHALRTRIALD